MAGIIKNTSGLELVVNSVSQDYRFTSWLTRVSVYSSRFDEASMEPVAVHRLKYEPGRCVTTVDVLMGGDVLRIVLSGAPELKAGNPLDALHELRREHDDFRRFLIEYPRGNEAINGCLLLPPFSPETVRTVVVAPQVGYVPIAGTPLMAAAAALVELGEVGAQDSITRVRFDSAKGLTEIEVQRQY